MRRDSLTGSIVRTGTLYIELRPTAVAEARNLVESTLIELDTNSGICAITLEHASERSELPWFFDRADRGA